MKGKKTCPVCGFLNALRSSKCKGADCDHKFYETEDEKNHVDWRTLQRGQMIRVLQGSGPVARTRDIEECIGSYGKFIVFNVTTDGIMSYGSCGLEFIYMGEEREGKLPGVILKPHKIRLVKQKVRVKE